MIIIMVMLILNVALILGTPTSPPRKLLFSETGGMGGLSHIIMSAHDIDLVMVMIKFVWDLGPTTLTTRYLIVGLMVVILCHIIVGKFYPLLINTTEGPMLN